jgi:4-diphosphocytidyl-2-C-methyl-D-erythritol kinase
LTVRAPAKINLLLEVLGRRPDGFHEIRTVMQAVSLFDELTLTREGGSEIEFHCADPGVPAGEENLVVRAALLLKRRYAVKEGARIGLKKHIPLGGGLGGGSSDCAAALGALRKLWNVDATDEELEQMGAELGSDVPFFFHQGTALCEGRGEKVSPIRCGASLNYVLVLPGIQVSTPEVYKRASPALTSSARNIKLVLEALKEGDVEGLGRALYNDLQEPAFQVESRLREMMGRLEALQEQHRALGKLLSGSGSSIFLLHRNESESKRSADLLQRKLSVSCIPVWGLTGGEQL